MPQRRRAAVADPTDDILNQINQAIGPDPTDRLLADIDKAIGSDTKAVMLARDRADGVAAPSDALPVTLRRGPSYASMADQVNAPAPVHVPSEVVPKGFGFGGRPAAAEPFEEPAVIAARNAPIPVTPRRGPVVSPFEQDRASLATGPSLNEAVEQKKAGAAQSPQPVIDPETHRLDRAVPAGMTPRAATSALDVVSGVLQAPYGAALAPSMAAGESLSDATLPGHEGEPSDFLGRLAAHGRMILRGEGGAVAPVLAGAVMNPPDTTEHFSDLQRAARAQANLPAPETRTKSRTQMVAEETARRVADMVSKMLVDPTAIAGMGISGVPGELLAAAFGAEGIRAAARVVQDPHATPEDVAEAMLGAALAAVPTAVRRVVPGAVNVTDAALGITGNAVRAGILASKLRLPTAVRGFGRTSEAGIHAPLEAMEHIGGQEQPPPVGQTLGEAIRSGLTPKPPEMRAYEERAAPVTATNTIAAIDQAIGPPEPRSTQGLTTAPAETPRPVAARPGVGESAGPVAPSPVPPPAASTVAPAEFTPVGEEPPTVSPAPVPTASRDTGSVLDRINGKLAHGEPLGTKDARDADEMRRRGEAARHTEDVIAQIDEAIGPSREQAPIEDESTRQLHQARADGYIGSDETFRQRFDAAVRSANEIAGEARDISGEDPHALFSAIAKYGGIRLNKDDPYHGEIAALWEHGGRDSQVNMTSTTGRAYSRRLPSAALAEVRGVLHQGKGLSLDHMAENLRQDPKYAHIDGPNTLLQAMDNALTRAQHDQGMRLSPNLSPNWWRDRDDVIIPNRAKDLTPEGRAIEDRAVQLLGDRPAAHVAGYREAAKADLSIDSAREYLQQQLGLKTTDEKLTSAMGLQEAARGLWKTAYRQAVQDPAPEGQSDLVVLKAGPMGAGKSTTFNSIPGSDTILDTAKVTTEASFSSFSAAKEAIDEALTAGNQVIFTYVHGGEPKALLHRTLNRATREGRPVRTDYLARSIARPPKVALQVLDAYRDDSRVEVVIVDNSRHGQPAELSGPALLEGLQYNETDLHGRLEDLLHRARQRYPERVPDAVYRATQTPVARRPEEVRQSDRRQPERESARAGQDHVSPSTPSPADIVQQINAAIGPAPSLPVKARRLALRVGSGTTVREVSSLEEAAQLFERGREAAEALGRGGSSQVPPGTVIDLDSGEPVARISYNGRIWPPGEWHPGMPELQERPDGRGYGKRAPIPVTPKVEARPTGTSPVTDPLRALVNRYKPGNPFAKRAAFARAHADKLNQQTAHEKGMAESFPLGAGFGHGSQRSRDKKMDASVNRASAAVRAVKDAEQFEAQAAAFDAGTINAQGRRWDAKKQEQSDKRATAQDLRDERIARTRQEKEVPPNSGHAAKEGALTEEPVKSDVPVTPKATPSNHRGGVSSMPMGASRQLPPPPRQGAQIPVTPRMKPSAIIENLRKGLGAIPVNVGRFRQQAFGIYKQKPQAIRLKVANDVQTLAHEFGHHVDISILGISRKDPRWRDELKVLGQPTSRPSYSLSQQRQEGAAEFLRLYLIDPAAAKADAPQYFAEFERRLEAQPELKTVLLNARADIAGLVSQDPATRGKLMIDFTGDDSPGLYRRLRDDPKGAMRDLATLWIDDLHALRVAVDEMCDARPIDARQNAYILARNARGTGGMAEGMLEHGVRGRNGRFLSRSLADAITPVKDHLQDFAAYLVANRVLEVQRLKGKETGMTAEEATAIIHDVETGPQAKAMQRAAENVHAYNRALLQYAREYHAIDQDLYAKLLAEADYVPLQRVSDAVGGAFAGGARKIANRSSPIKRMKGSGRDIINPLESIVRNTFTIIDMVEKNRAMQALVRQADKSAGSAKWLEKVPPPQVATQFNLSQISKEVRTELEGMGLDLPDNFDLDAFVRVFTPANFAMPGQNLVTVIRDGKRQFYEVHDQALYDAITAIGGRATSTLIEWASKPAALLRAGATLTPGFIARNPTRDTLVAFMQSRYGFIPVYDTIEGFLSLALGEHEANLFLTSGVQQSSLVGADRDRLRKAIERMPAQSKAKFFANIVLHPIDLLRAISENMESATRMGEFRLALNAAGQERRAGAVGVLQRLVTKNTPAFDDETLTRATLAARDVTTDFSRGGSFSKEANRVYAFFNARIQGFVRMAETIGRDPVGTALTVAMLSALSYALWSLNEDDDAYAELPDWEKNAYWHIPVKLFKRLGLTNKSSSSFIKVAKPFEWAYLPNLMETALSYVKSKNPDALNRIKPPNAGNLAFSLIPSALLPLLEASFNYDTFRNGPIVKPWDVGLEPELQRSEWTTDTAVQIGKLLNISPAKADHIIFGYGAGFARGIVEHGTDPALALGGLITPKKAQDPEKKWQRVPVVGTFLREGTFDSSSQSLKDFYTAHDRVINAERSAKRFGETDPHKAIAFVKGVSDERWVQRRQQIKAAKTVLEDIGDQVNAIYAAPPAKMTPQQKRQQLDRAYERMVQIARLALGKPPLQMKAAK